LKRIIVTVIALGAIIGLGAGMLSAGGVAEAHGVSPAKLGNAGWTCFDVPGLGVHCQPPGSEASSASLSLLVFDTSDPGAGHAPFSGTEILIRADLYNGQPCPGEGADDYEGLDLFGGPEIDYYACHHPHGGH
jgi:hypothetical protein